ncbi:MAG: hypothetical protein WBL40_00230 [Terrimicrobiaceae bacterium]
MITNSLTSTDGVPVHSKYQRYRKPLFQAGVEVSYRVEFVGKRLGWVTREGGKELRFDSEPEASLWKRVRVRVLSRLPIEGLL